MPKEQHMSFSGETVKMLSDKGYHIDKQIGYGSYSNVYKGRKGKDTEVAIKVIDLVKASPNYRDKFFPRERNMILNVKHKYIIVTHDVLLEKDHSKGINRAFIFMDLAKTDLLTVIEKRKKIDEVQCKVWFHQITEALTFMHSKNYAHRDLKLENILINSKNVALVSDFGFVREVTNHKEPSTTFCGSESYAAPEILHNHPYDPFASDVWSLGVCIYASLTGHMPFHGKHDQLKHEQTKSESIVSKTHISKESKDLLPKLLKYKEKERIKMKDVLHHEWFKTKPVKST